MILFIVVSGSLAWKAARHELGDGERVAGEDSTKDERASTLSFHVESFYPSVNQNDLTIVVQPPRPSSKSHLECIMVNGIACAATSACGISVVIVDETSGCILHSKSISSWSVAGRFLDCIHSGRIVALCGIRGEENTTKEGVNDDSTTTYFRRLGGFNIDASLSSTERFVLFVGQLNFHPNWATNICTSDIEQAITVTLPRNTTQLKVRLRSEINAVPAVVLTRLPDDFMPLQNQLVASNFQKRAAFNKFVEAGSHNNNLSVNGYITRQGAPIYLIDGKSYPFRRSGDQPKHGIANDVTPWVTYHFLPESLVPDDDEVIDDSKSTNTSNTPTFDIPIADDYFAGLLGNQLLVKNDSSAPSLLDTAVALSNSRLVALYFSAQWCGPCRVFTPLLIEFYNYLQEVAPVQGMKIVFISSDQDEEQFHAYYGKMPFLALPFSQRALAQHAKSVFGVRGIPSLVIIDALSGRIVQTPDESRRDVHQACQQGEDAIEMLFRKWLDNVPDETKSILDILAISCQDEETSASSKLGDGYSSKVESYLFRKRDNTPDKEDGEGVKSTADFSARVKEIFAQLVATGMQPNSAAAEAIKQATTEQNAPFVFELKAGTLTGTSEVCVARAMNDKICELNRTDIVTILTTAKRYLTNVQKDQSNPRFRNFRLGNKVFDQITSIPGGIAFLTDLGFSVFHSDDDFIAIIPLTVDLEAIANVFDKLLSKC